MQQQPGFYLSATNSAVRGLRNLLHGCYGCFLTDQQLLWGNGFGFNASSKCTDHERAWALEPGEAFLLDLTLFAWPARWRGITPGPSGDLAGGATQACGFRKAVPFACSLRMACKLDVLVTGDFGTEEDFRSLFASSFVDHAAGPTDVSGNPGGTANEGTRRENFQK